MENCKQIKKLISDYLDNECSLNQRQSVAQHIEHCDNCKSELNVYKDLSSILKELPEVSPSNNYMSGFNEKLAKTMYETPIQPVRIKVHKKYNFLKYASLSIAAMVTFVAGVMFLSKENPEDVSVPTITYVKGDVNVISSNNFIKHAKKKLNISAGQTISTGKFAKIDIEYKGRFKVSLKENTTVKINELAEQNGLLKFRCALQTGSMLADISKRKKLSDFRINTKIANVKVCGTKFMVESYNNSDSNKQNVGVAVLEGKVEVTQEVTRRNTSKIEKYFVTENQKMIFEQNNSPWFNRELSSNDFEKLLEVYDISRRDVDIKYQSGQTKSPSPFRSESFE